MLYYLQPGKMLLFNAIRHKCVYLLWACENNEECLKCFTVILRHVAQPSLVAKILVYPVKSNNLPRRNKGQMKSPHC
jgi:hypothetical protein